MPPSYISLCPLPFLGDSLLFGTLLFEIGLFPVESVSTLEPLPPNGGYLPVGFRDWKRLQDQLKRCLAPRGIVFPTREQALQAAEWVRAAFTFANVVRWRPEGAPNVLNGIDPKVLREADANV